MPIYEYECPKCGVFEAMQKITDPPLKRCPTCKSRVRKLVSLSSFQLKGSGWYATDYANKGDGKGQKKQERKEAQTTSASSCSACSSSTSCETE